MVFTIKKRGFRLIFSRKPISWYHQGMSHWFLEHLEWNILSGGRKASRFWRSKNASVQWGRWSQSIGIGGPIDTSPVHCQILKRGNVQLFQRWKQNLYSFLFTLPKVTIAFWFFSIYFLREIDHIVIPSEVVCLRSSARISRARSPAPLHTMIPQSKKKKLCSICTNTDSANCN